MNMTWSISQHLHTYVRLTEKLHHMINEREQQSRFLYVYVFVCGKEVLRCYKNVRDWFICHPIKKRDLYRFSKLRQVPISIWPPSLPGEKYLKSCRQNVELVMRK